VQYIGLSAEKSSIEVTRLHHSIQAAFNKTKISIFERKLPQSKLSRKLNSSSTIMTQLVAEQPEYCSYKNYENNDQ